MRVEKLGFENIDKWLNYVAAYKGHKIYILSARNNKKTRMVCLFRKVNFDKANHELFGSYFDLEKPVGFIDDGMGIEMVRHAMVWALNVIDKTPGKEYEIPEMSGLAQHNIINKKCFKGKKGDETKRIFNFLDYLGKTERNRWAVATLDGVETKKRG